MQITAKQSTKNFSVDKSIIKHLVTHQAGSIEKAILELVMNLKGVIHEIMNWIR